MGISKTEHFSDKQNNVANLLKAMGHPARMTILDCLSKADALTCGDIVNELPLAQSTVSQHLKELKTAGIINSEAEGASMYYYINEKAVKKLQKYFVKFARKVEKKKGKKHKE